MLQVRDSDPFCCKFLAKTDFLICTCSHWPLSSRCAVQHEMVFHFHCVPAALLGRFLPNLGPCTNTALFLRSTQERSGLVRLACADLPTIHAYDAAQAAVLLSLVRLRWFPPKKDKARRSNWGGPPVRAPRFFWIATPRCRWRWQRGPLPSSLQGCASGRGNPGVQPRCPAKNLGRRRIQPSGRVLSLSPKARCMNTASSQRPNLKPTEVKVPAR